VLKLSGKWFTDVVVLVLVLGRNGS